MEIDKGLQYKYDDYFVKKNRKQNSLKKVKYRKIAIVNTLKKYCDLNRKKVVLDIGFGQTDGLITQEIAKNSLKIYGIELDSNDVKIAKSKNKEANCIFLKADTRNLSMFNQNMFDIIVCTDVIEHIPKDIEKLFSEMYRTLKKKGYIYITLENKFILKEPHYGLYFLSWLPKSLADKYVKLTKRGRNYEIVHFTYYKFKKYILENSFKYKNITFNLVKNAKKLGYKINPSLSKLGGKLDKLPKKLKECLYFIIPEWFIVLRK